MRTAEQIYALLVEANPVPDPEASLESATQPRPALQLVDPRRPVMQTQQDGKQQEPQVTKPKPRRYSWVYAAAAFALVVMIGAVTALVLRSGGDSDDVIANIDATPTTTVAQPETATTTAPVTTTAAVTSTTLSEAAAIATAEAFQEALNAYDSDAAAALLADGGFWIGTTPGSSRWEQFLVDREAWGHHGTLSDCEVTDGVLTCLVTWERTNLSGKAGVIRVKEWQVRFDDQGLITHVNHEHRSGEVEAIAFWTALGDWMATTHPEAYETFFYGLGNWNVVSATKEIDQLMPLIDEFIAQSDDYPLDS